MIGAGSMNKQMFYKVNLRIDRTFYKIQSPDDIFSDNCEKIVHRVGFFSKYNFTSGSRYYLKKTG